jgi:hypothetical protein
MTRLRLDLFRDAVKPGAPGPGSYTDFWRQQISTADSAAWNGLFDSADGDRSFANLGFADGSRRAGADAFKVDWDEAGTGVAISTGLAWNAVKNIAIREFDGESLAVRNFVDVLIELGGGTAGQSVSADGLKRGSIVLGAGDDTLFLGLDSNTGDWGNTVFVDTGAGNDTVTIAASTQDYSASFGRAAYQAHWSSSHVALGAGDDSIVADGSNDTVWGGTGDDRAELRGGVNWFDGEAGCDTIVLRGLYADYDIQEIAGGWMIRDLAPTADGDDGVVSIFNVEKAVFQDQTWRIAPCPEEKQANRPPVVTDEPIIIYEDTEARVNVLFNDSDPDGDAIAIGSFSQGAHGYVVQDDANVLRYVPFAEFSGEDSFTYEVQDGRGGSTPGTVTLTVLPVNDAPFYIDPGDTAAISELPNGAPGENNTVLSAAGSLRFSDFDIGDVHSVSVAALGQFYVGAFEASVQPDADPDLPADAGGPGGRYRHARHHDHPGRHRRPGGAAVLRRVRRERCRRPVQL